MKIIFILIFLFAKLGFAQDAANNSQPSNVPPPLPPISQVPVVPNIAPAIPNVANTNSSNQVSPPIFTLTDQDKQNITELNKFIDDLDPKVKDEIIEFDNSMKKLRALSQKSYNKLSHEAKLALKSKKDKIDYLSDAAKKSYYKNE